MTRLRLAAAVCIAAGALVFASAGGAQASVPGPSAAPEYWFGTWHVPQLWQQGARGQGVTIAEIDTGVTASLPELSGRILRGKDFGADGGDGRTDRDRSDFGHGTAMASIMVAHPGELDITGLAPDAQVLPLAVPLIGTTDHSQNDHVDEAIRYAVNHGAKIISMSLGGTRTPADGLYGCPVAEQQAVYYALSKGAVLFAAAGNKAAGRSGTHDAVEEPGVCLGVISVGATDSNGRLAPFSLRHPYQALSAPGVGIASLGRQAGSAFDGRGTSQATALAAASAALVWSKFPSLTATQLTARLLATTDHHSSSRDPGYGYGIVNPYRAITRSVPTSAPDPIAAAVAPFVARFRAQQHEKPATGSTPPSAPRRQDLGSTPRPVAPNRADADVIRGLGISVAGVVLLVVLLAVAVVRRRRRIEQDVRDLPAPSHDVVDAGGLVWREIGPRGGPPPGDAG